MGLCRKGDFVTSEIAAVFHKPLGEFAEKRIQHRRHAATDNHYIRLQQINNVAQPQRQQFDGFLQNLFGQGITGNISLAHHFTGYGIDVSFGKIKNVRAGTLLGGQLSSRSSRYRWPSSQNFDAARLAASASRTVVIDTHMSTFARSAGTPVVNPLVAHYASANSSPDGRVEDVVKTAPRAPYGLGQRRRVGIVLDLYGHVIDFRHLRSEGEISPARNIGRIDDNSRMRVQRSRRADTNSTNPGASFRVLGKEEGDRRYYGHESVGGLAVRHHGSADLRFDFATAVHQAGCDLGATNIHANHESIVRFCHRRLSRRNSSRGASLRISCSWICTTPSSVPAMARAILHSEFAVYAADLEIAEAFCQRTGERVVP